MKRLFILAAIVAVLASCAMAQSQYTILQYARAAKGAAKSDTTAWLSGYYDKIVLTTYDSTRVVAAAANRSITVQYKYFFKRTATTWDSSTISRALVGRGIDSLRQAYSYELTGPDSIVAATGHVATDYNGFKQFRIITLALVDSLYMQHQLYFLK
jgi:hypothetical protein